MTQTIAIKTSCDFQCGVCSTCKPTPASRFYQAHLSPEAVQNKLRAAMVRAGEDPELVAVVFHEDCDEWADLDGVKVLASGSTLERAVRWVEAYLAPRVREYRRLAKVQASVYRADPTTGEVLFRRWPLGD